MTDATLTENTRGWFDALAVIKTRAADTNGQLTIIEVTEPPNAEASLHVHHHEGEAFYVLEGDVTIHVGDDVVEAGPGDFAFGPRDIPHRYTVGRDGCRNAVHLHARRHRRPRHRHEPSGGKPHAPAVLHRGA